MPCPIRQNSTRGVQWGGRELKAARMKLGYGQTDLARALNTPLRTVQDWERGVRPMPGIVPVTVGLLLEKDAWVMERVRRAVDERARAEFPGGIVSEVGEL